MTTWPTPQVEALPPGLDPAALRSRLTSWQEREPRALGFVGGHRPAWVAWSGGKDSTVTAHLVHRVWPGTPIVHFDSGFDFPEVTEYLGRLSLEMGWDYDPIGVGSALEAMLATGTWDHDGVADPDGPDWWEVTIAGPARLASERYGSAMAWGLRSDESAGRRAYARHNGDVFERQDGVVVTSPVLWWTAADIWAYLTAHDVEPCPVYARLAALGVPERARRVSLLISSDGLGQGRAMWLRRGWPDLYQRLVAVLPRLREFT